MLTLPLFTSTTTTTTTITTTTTTTVALRMHEKNLEMKTLREVMEKKMRDQLVSTMSHSSHFDSVVVVNIYV